jgi:ubiquinone/menaquinone biosynthesis C-methylase UbiE
MSVFKDHFSGHADRYARYRPDYPRELFDYLATLTPRREHALDCATGSGQAAAGLAAHFERVIATDGSIQQLQHARRHPRVVYVCNLAEQPAFKDQSIDLMVAAQAAHWFDHDRFYAQARRVLRREGALAVWTYGMARIDPAIDVEVLSFYRDVVGPYWPPERRYIESAYHNLPFAMQEEPAPELEISMQWDLETFVGYVGTWSAVQRYTKEMGVDPLLELQQKLAALWNSADAQRSVVWPLHIRVGRST